MTHKLIDGLFMRRLCLLNSKFRTLSSKVPRKSCWKPTDEDSIKIPDIEDDLVKYLERTSLVQFSSDDSRRQLRDFITFANQLRSVDTNGVEPLHSLLEAESVYMREDVITEGNCREELLSLSSKTVENCYYVAPPGNVRSKQKKMERNHDIFQ